VDPAHLQAGIQHIMSEIRRYNTCSKLLPPMAFCGSKYTKSDFGWADYEVSSDYGPESTGEPT